MSELKEWKSKENIKVKVNFTIDLFEGEWVLKWGKTEFPHGMILNSPDIKVDIGVNEPNFKALESFEGNSEEFYDYSKLEEYLNRVKICSGDAIKTLYAQMGDFFFDVEA